MFFFSWHVYPKQVGGELLSLETCVGIGSILYRKLSFILNNWWQTVCIKRTSLEKNFRNQSKVWYDAMVSLNAHLFQVLNQ